MCENQEKSVIRKMGYCKKKLELSENRNDIAQSLMKLGRLIKFNLCGDHKKEKLWSSLAQVPQTVC